MLADLSRGETAAPWSLPRRLAFRFAFIYFGIYFFPPPVPLFDLLNVLWSRGAMRIAVFAGVHLLGIHRAIDTVDNGSADSTAYWLQCFCGLLVAVVGTLVWSLLDRRRPGYDRLGALAHTYLRFVLAFTMFTYAVVKLLPIQFPPLTPIRLYQRIGDQSPMGLLWTFMGYSRPYNWFAGGAELAGTLLLLWRRTATLGALITFAVMTHVALLNFCYDVPVKNLSLHLWLAAGLLLVPDLRRLARAILVARPRLWTVQRRGPRLAVATGKWLVVVATLTLTGWRMVAFGRVFRSGTPPALVGAWELDEARAGDSVPDGWRRIGLGQGSLVVLGPDGATVTRFMAAASAPGTLDLRRDEAAPPTTLRYGQEDPGHLTLEGTIGTVTIHAHLHKLDADALDLPSRGFHFVSEIYYNH